MESRQDRLRKVVDIVIDDFYQGEQKEKERKMRIRKGSKKYLMAEIKRLENEVDSYRAECYGQRMTIRSMTESAERMKAYIKQTQADEKL